MPHADAALDQELARLLDAYGTAFYESASASLLAYLDAHYVRRRRGAGFAIVSNYAMRA